MIATHKDTRSGAYYRLIYKGKLIGGDFKGEDVAVFEGIKGHIWVRKLEDFNLRFKELKHELVRPRTPEARPGWWRRGIRKSV